MFGLPSVFAVVIRTRHVTELLNHIRIPVSLIFSVILRVCATHEVDVIADVSDVAPKIFPKTVIQKVIG
jgi:hypothetical protein